MEVLEYLDFERCKRWLRTKLGAMLRVIPYRPIRKAFERRCLVRHFAQQKKVASQHPTWPQQFSQPAGDTTANRADAPRARLRQQA